MGSVAKLGASYMDEVDDHDLYYAAEAVVKAAICCHDLERKLIINDETKELLIRAVMEDPALTASLFRREY